MKSRLIVIFIFLFLLNGWTQTRNLKVYLENGTVETFSIQDIKKITFKGFTNIKKTKEYSHLINKFNLLQNHPNPFNTNTIIEYKIQKSGFVNLKIYDINGKLVKTFSQNCQAGLNKTIWDGKNSGGDLVASGIYLYQVIFENSIFAKRMILLK